MNTAWTNGYQTTVNYTYGYYRDLSPNYQRFCMLLNGVDCPPENQMHTHCELGFGQGLSLNVHAASSDSPYWGTDFNPAHAAHAQKIAEHSHIQQQFFDDSFEEFLNRDDLPQFDSISLHGIWSWISYENQLIILKFIRKYLKPSGIVYMSYNCSTGWAGNMPVRELFYSHYKFNSKSHNPMEKVKEALGFGKALFEQQPLFLTQNPKAIDKLQQLEKQNPNYLIHEYLNQDWQCFSFQQIVRLFEDIKLSYAGTTDVSSLIEYIHLSTEQQQFLNQIDHPVLKEQCRDYFTANQFRRDLYVRGKNNLNSLQVMERLRATAFVFLGTLENLPDSIVGNLGRFELVQEVYEKIAQQFIRAEYAPLTIRALENNVPDLSYEQILNAMVILCHLGFVQPCQNVAPSDQVLEQCHALNRYLLTQAQFHNQYQVLANPITGIGVTLSQLDQLYFYAYFVEGLTTPADMAECVQHRLDNLQIAIIDGDEQAINDRKKSLKVLEQRIKAFFDAKRIEIAKQLRLFE